MESIASDLRDRLPNPLMPSRQDWVEMYWKAWSFLVQNISHGSAENGFTGTYLDAAFNGNIFQWDTCFMVQFARYGYHFLPVLPSLDNFYRKQDSDGYICREYRRLNGKPVFSKSSADAVNPPLFSWAEWEYYRISNGLDRLHKVLPGLISYYRWLAAGRQNESGLYWSSPLGCGMDNTPRYAANWIDFSAQQVLNSLCIARIAGALGQDKTAEEFYDKNASLSKKINELMWDEKEGYYWDLDTANAYVPVKTIAPFWTLLAEAASPERVSRLAEHLSNPGEFWRPHVFPTLSADHPLYSPNGDYWRGSVWPLTNYAVIKGLSRCGHKALAIQASENHLKRMALVYKETGSIWENYSSEHPGPGSLAKKDFVGFSGLGPIALLIEEILGIEVDAPSNTLFWRLYPVHEQGLRNLRFGNNRVSLLARKEKEGKIVIEIAAKQGFTLKILTKETQKIFSVPMGTHRYVLPRKKN